MTAATTNLRQQLLKLQGEQLQLGIKAIRLAIQHSATKGTEAELAFRRLLRKYLPQRYQLGSGFVVSEELVSNQHDIIIYDELINVPMYLEDGAGCFLGGAVYGVIETTAQVLNRKKLKEDIKKIARLRKIFPGEKIKFQQVISCPLVNREKLKADFSASLSSGFCIDTFWPEIERKCISDRSAFDVAALNQTESLDLDQKSILSDLVKKQLAVSQQSLSVVKTIISPPPPRTYLCALHGTSYKTIKKLNSAVYELTRELGAHIHGLLVFNEDGNDWLISTKAFANGETDVNSQDAFLKFIQKMNLDFQGLLVGKFPAEG